LLHLLEETIVMQPYCTAPRKSTASFYKSALVDVGIVALAAGDWQLVQTITSLIRARRWGHA
jgi:hypothetical protein